MRAIGLREHHQIAALIVPVDEAAWPGRDRRGQVLGGVTEYGALIGAERDAARLQCPLPEMIDLPTQEISVERALQDDGMSRQGLERTLRTRQIPNGALIQRGLVLGR